MVRFNEALLVGISLLAALVFSKGRGSTPSDSNIPFINPFTDMFSKAQAQAIEKQESNIATLENIRQSNLGIAQDILDYEKNISDVKIQQYQTELDKTQSFISQQQKFTPANPNRNPSTRNAEYRDYYGTKMWENWIIQRGATQTDRNLILQQAKFETAQQNIAKANELVFRQQGEIDRLQEEYQTRYGNLSRYG